MAILFYEGLPGAGKSYEAMATQIIPFLHKGREVVAYIEGLDHERIAEASGVPVERVRELLFVLTRDDMRPREIQKGGKTVAVDGTWIDKVRDNAFLVFDESQNWWPNRLRPTDALTQFVTEHRHRGIDVLLMGQSLLDLSALWRRRVDQKFTFLKLTVLGSDKKYRVTVFKGQGNDQFVKVTDKVGKYDPKYFGTYASHVAADTNTVTYTDKRASFLNSNFVRVGVPLLVVMACLGSWKIVAYFHPDKPKPGSLSAAKAISPLQTAAVGPSGPQVVQAGPTPAVDTRSAEERYFADLGAKGARARLAGLMTMGGRSRGLVEWVDGNTRVIERIELDTLRDLGVAVRITGPTVRLSLGAWSVLATMWPVEAEGRVSDYRQATIRPGGEVAGSSGQPLAPSDSPVRGSVPGLIVFGGGPSDEAAAPAQESQLDPSYHVKSKIKSSFSASPMT